MLSSWRAFLWWFKMKSAPFFVKNKMDHCEGLIFFKIERKSPNTGMGSKNVFSFGCFKHLQDISCIIILLRPTMYQNMPIKTMPFKSWTVVHPNGTIWCPILSSILLVAIILLKLALPFILGASSTTLPVFHVAAIHVKVEFIIFLSSHFFVCLS